MNGSHVVAEVRSWIGTPYVPQASLKGVGSDCVGLAIGVGKELGLIDDAYAAPVYLERDAEILARELALLLDPIDTPEEGAVLVFIIGRNRHVGICTGESLVHLHGSKYGVTEIPLAEKWLSRLESCWQFRGLDG